MHQSGLVPSLRLESAFLLLLFSIEAFEPFGHGFELLLDAMVNGALRIRVIGQNLGQKAQFRSPYMPYPLAYRSFGIKIQQYGEISHEP